MHRKTRLNHTFLLFQPQSSSNKKEKKGGFFGFGGGGNGGEKKSSGQLQLLVAKDVTDQERVLASKGFTDSWFSNVSVMISLRYYGRVEEGSTTQLGAV